MAVKLNQENLNAARMIIEHPITKEILDDMELQAVNAAVQALNTDVTKQSAYLAEVRAIRSFRSKLGFIISETPAVLKRIEAAK